MSEFSLPTAGAAAKRRLYWLAAAVVFILIAVLLVAFAPRPVASPQPQAAPSVPVISVKPQELQIPLRSHGQVQMAREYQLSSRAGGRVIFLSDQFVSGGHIRAGELLVKIDDQVYQLEVSQRQAELDSRLLQLEEIRAKASVAQLQAADNDFARFIPQLRMANSQVDAARAALKYARQQLQDTQIVAPVSGRLAQVLVQPGQLVQAAQTLASIYDDSWQEVALTISDSDAALLRLENNQQPHTVKLHSNGRTIAARIVRSEARRADFQQIVLIARPQYQAGEIPLLPGTYVDADIFTPPMQNIISVPRSALQADNRLWLVDSQQQLQSVEADIIYRAQDTLYLRNPLPADTLVVNSSRRSLLAGLTVVPVAVSNQTIAATNDE